MVPSLRSWTRDPRRRSTALGDLEISVTPRLRLDSDTVKQFEDLGVHRLIALTPQRSAEELMTFIKRTADEVFEVTGHNPLLDMALELERIALDDDFFISRHLYPNVDFYSGLIYQALGFPVEMFPVLFAIPRTVGWLAQWEELLEDEDQSIARPRQIFTGSAERDFVPVEDR